MADPYFNLGEALLGADIDRPGAYLQGLNTGSQINLRKSQTENAMAQARERRAKAEARAKLAEVIDDPRLATIIAAGENPEQYTGALGDIQSQGFRSTIADPTLDIASRQAAAQAVAGKPLTASDVLGPGGELFVDVFNPSADTLSVTPTGTAQIGADEALAEQRRASAALSRERAAHPERFKSNLHFSLGGTGLGDQILSEVESTDTTLPQDITYSGATGISGFTTNLANTVFDVAEMGIPFKSEEQARNALRDLFTRTQIVSQQAVPGRPSNYLMEQLSAFGVEPGTLTRGDEGSLYRLNQTSRYLGGEIERLRQMVNRGELGGLTKADISDASLALRDLASLKRDYDIAIQKLSGEESGAAPAGGSDDLNSLGVGQSVTRNGVTITRKN